MALRILLAPSEGKRPGGEGSFDPCTLFGEELCPLRRELIAAYEAIITGGDDETLHTLFGLKKESEIARYRGETLLGSPVRKALERYDGVAFDALDYPSLGSEAQRYLDDRVVIFSNLFGPVRGGDRLPDYRVSQGAAVGEHRVDRLYKEAASSLLEEAFDGDEILDLRAGYYDRFYKPARPYTTMKFLKNGRVVSHWAKAWRGRIARAAAQAQVDTIEALLALPIEGMRLVEIRSAKGRQEVIYAVE
ncbi:YaaA family protein [Nitratifractor sp.]